MRVINVETRKTFTFDMSDAERQILIYALNFYLSDPALKASAQFPKALALHDGLRDAGTVPSAIFTDC